jgi:Arm domain-containing DNA-binding protein
LAGNPLAIASREAGCQEAAMIYKRGKRWRVIVYAGRDPITGCKRQKSVSVATRAEAKLVEARLITEVGAGQHRGSSNRTVAELLDRWLEWRLAGRGDAITPANSAERGQVLAAAFLIKNLPPLRHPKVAPALPGRPSAHRST